MIQLSPAAVSEVLRLRNKRKTSDLFLRLGVQPSNCLTLSYTIDFDQTIQPGDQVYECGHLQVVVGADSLAYIDGLALDYSEDLMGGGFRFHNPNAQQTCGCGNSFSVTD
jgi:iron-sulfur cluster assembly accessory protein